MFWDKKKKESGLPDLPPQRFNFPTINDYTKEEELEEIHDLPSFPSNPSNKGFMQSVIKDAVTEEERLPEIKESPIPSFAPAKTIEVEEHMMQSRPSYIEKTIYPEKLEVIDKKPIFIRLDKFHEAKESLGSISSKINEMEGMLRKLKEVKTKEDQELMAWEKEMHSLKSHLRRINEDILSKA